MLTPLIVSNRCFKRGTFGRVSTSLVPVHAMTILGDSDPKLIVVAAVLGPNRGIGLNNDLPWPSIPADLAWLQRITTKLPSDADPSHKMNAVLLGRVTWQSVPVKEMHLPQRHNVVISRQRNFPV